MSHLTFKQFLLENRLDKGIFKAIFLAGTPGSGKSYTISQLSSGSIAPRIVNTDKFIELRIKQKKEYDYSTYTSPMTSTKKQLAHYLNGMLPLFIDGTSSNINDLVMRAGVLEPIGYDIGMIFVNTSLETSITRAEKRERKVDPDFIKQVYDLAADNKSYYQSKFDFFLDINNDAGELTDEVILKAFKKTTSFFNSDVKNPIGKRTIKKLEETKEKYLVPSIIGQSEINQKVEGWY